MASKDFSNTLKNLRIKAGYTQKQVYEYFDIPQSTFSSWEVGKSEPSGDMLIKLCEFYKCDMMKEFSAPDNILFTANELNVIEKYRDLDDHGRESVNITLDREAKRVKTITIQSARIAELEAAQSPVTKEQAATIEFQRPPKQLYSYPYLGKIACAGTGFYFDDIPTDMLNAPHMENADYIIGVSGDSMEPDYHDGEKLYVQKVDEIHKGQVGIFTINNECFLKEFGDNGLVSLNPDYANIPGDQDVRLIGRVVGKVEE